MVIKSTATDKSDFAGECMGQRTEANDAGKDFEYIIGKILKRHGIGYRHQFYTGVRDEDYDKQIVVDFYLPSVKGFLSGLYVEARWQESAGSTEEKASALKDRIVKYYDRPTIVVCGGKEVDRQYQILLGACKVERGNLIAAFRFERFFAFAPTLGNGQSVCELRREFHPDQTVLFA